MPKTITIIRLCCVMIVATALFTVTQLMAGGTAGEKLGSQLIRELTVPASTHKIEGEKPDPKFIQEHQARTSYNETVVAGLKKRYFRDDRGCAYKVEFLNEMSKCRECADSLKQAWEKCTADKACRTKLEGKTFPRQSESEWVEAIEPKTWPKVWGEYLVGAGTTKGESGDGVCIEWRFTVAGSPGWDCDYIGNRLVCSCIGYYYEPLDWCCQPTGCHPKP